MAKRKRGLADDAGSAPAAKSWKQAKATATAEDPKQPLHATARASKSKEAATGKINKEAQIQEGAADLASPWSKETTTIQIITGSYERALHGFTAAIPRSLVTGQDGQDHDPKEHGDSKVDFSDTFLFNAHASAIRCLALSPPPENPNGKIFLATGSTDERINLYSVSLRPPAVSGSKPKLPTLHGTPITENSRNRELGSLLHHSSSITALHFPTRAKLLSAAEDSTIAITRTRDWTPLSTIKAPIPKPQGRPSGDTAGPGEVPSGINDFAIHPSMKLMLSVGKGEKCIRLWNLVTGKKAGVLNFSREILGAVGEGRFGTGEGRRVVWDAEGEEFAAAFERGVVIFGIDCKPKANITPSPRTKIHQMHYLPRLQKANILAISTEDGRVLFYDASSTNSDEKSGASSALIAQLGGPAAGISGRVKDFEIMPITTKDGTDFLIIAASSDGSVRLWAVAASELQPRSHVEGLKSQSGFTAKQAGKLIGQSSTGTRITCLKAFIMTGDAEGDEKEEENGKQEESGTDSDDTSD